jgi:hypothetical protein
MREHKSSVPDCRDGGSLPHPPTCTSMNGVCSTLHAYIPVFVIIIWSLPISRAAAEVCTFSTFLLAHLYIVSLFFQLALYN